MLNLEAARLSSTRAYGQQSDRRSIIRDNRDVTMPQPNEGSLALSLGVRWRKES
jgi:hypothetical protein